jgi:hypothetical protein
LLDFRPGQDETGEGTAVADGKVRFPGHFYEATSEVVLRVKGNRLTIARGSTFKLSCYGRSRTAPLWPAVMLLQGSVTLTTAKARPAGVTTEEGLYDPRTVTAMRYRVSRTLSSKSSPTFEEKLRWFGDQSNQPTGTTKVRSMSRGVIVGVTPYVGKGKGRCRYVRSARLTTKGSYGNGTARFTS